MAGQQQIAWANSYQQAVLNVFSDLPPSASLFSTACEAHCLSLNTTLSALEVNGVPLSSVLSFWFFADAGGAGEIQNVDPCTGWGCTNRCTGGIWSPANGQCDAPSAAEQAELGYDSGGGGAGGTGPFCGTPGAVPAGTAAQDAQAAAFAGTLTGAWLR